MSKIAKAVERGTQRIERLTTALRALQQRTVDAKIPCTCYYGGTDVPYPGEFHCSICENTGERRSP